MSTIEYSGMHPEAQPVHPEARPVHPEARPVHSTLTNLFSERARQDDDMPARHVRDADGEQSGRPLISPFTVHSSLFNVTISRPGSTFTMTRACMPKPCCSSQRPERRRHGT